MSALCTLAEEAAHHIGNRHESCIICTHYKVHLCVLEERNCFPASQPHSVLEKRLASRLELFFEILDFCVVACRLCLATHCVSSVCLATHCVSSYALCV